MTWRPSFVEEYDQLIFDKKMRSFFGTSGYYNVGYWANGADTPERASEALTDRMIARLPDDLEVVADIGCGLGATTRRLAELRPHSKVLAVNFSQAQLDACGLRCPAATLVRADAVSTGLPTSTLSAILSIEAALHFNTRKAFFRESYRLLKPGGTLALTDVLFAEEGWPGSWTVPVANYLPNVAGYTAALIEANFEEIQIEDARHECWGGFCQAQKELLLSATASAQEVEALTRYLSDLQRGATNYLLVTAKKPR